MENCVHHKNKTAEVNPYPRWKMLCGTTFSESRKYSKEKLISPLSPKHDITYYGPNTSKESNSKDSGPMCWLNWVLDWYEPSMAHPGVDALLWTIHHTVRFTHAISSYSGAVQVKALQNRNRKQSCNSLSTWYG